MGLFKKDKQLVINKAHSLIDEANALYKEHDRLLKDWQKELKQASTAKERAKINDKYEKLDSKFSKAEDKPYDEYYALMHKEFGKIELSDYEDLPDKFIDKKLVERLSEKK